MKTTDTVLDKIVADKKVELAARKRQKPLVQLEKEVAALDVSDAPDFYEALKVERPHPKIIAEVKKASPSAGVLREDFSLEKINQAYQEANQVVAISVITESKHFQGSDDFLTYFARHNPNNKPLLRKDFLFEPYQILESKLLGAHAYLLITSLFEESELAELVDFGLMNGIEPLVEVHTQKELDVALKTRAKCIGVNARDLKTFDVDPAAHNLLDQIDSSYARIVESGIDNPGYLYKTVKFSDAALIGTKFMQSKDVAETLGAFK